MKRLSLVALSLLLVLTAGCGSDDGSDAGSASDPTDASTDGGSEVGGPVTIDHAYGTTTIEETPERIVALDLQWADVLVALDGPLVGAALDPQVEGGRHPWQDFPDEVEGIQVTDAIPYERVAALQPDLIVVSWAAENEGIYERLTGIAPTVATLGDRQVDTWQDITTAAGEILGRPDDAAALIEDVDDQIEGLAEDLPGLEGKDYAFANYVPGDAIWVVTDPEDGAATFFAQLGLEIDPDLLELAGGDSGRLELSLERIDELDSDLLLMLTNGEDPADIPGYATLPAVETGAVAIVDVSQATALNTPSPLSLPWVMDQIRPALEAAAA